MKSIRDEITIDAPPADVFAFFRTMDERSYLAWHEEHIAFHFVEGDRIEPGATAFFDEEVGDERLASTVRYTAVEPPRYVEFRDTNHIKRLFNPKNTFAFEPVDGGTRFVAEVYLRIGPLERLSRQVRHELDELRRHVREEGENLKGLIESGQFDPETGRLAASPPE